MVFNSFAFLAFFVVVTTLFFVLPHGLRWLLLLSASCFFYMFFVPIFILYFNLNHLNAEGAAILTVLLAEEIKRRP